MSTDEQPITDVDDGQAPIPELAPYYEEASPWGERRWRRYECRVVDATNSRHCPWDTVSGLRAMYEHLAKHAEVLMGPATPSGLVDSRGNPLQR